MRRFLENIITFLLLFAVAYAIFFWGCLVFRACSF